jgi:CBS domain-containing protein
MIRAKEIMNTNVITIGRDEDLGEAIRSMVLNNITGLPVVEEDGTLAGIITEKDALMMLSDRLPRPTRVADFMTTKVVCFDQEDSLSTLATCFRLNSFRRVPILDRGRLVGIVSRKDIIHYINDTTQGDEVLKDSILEILF